MKKLFLLTTLLPLWTQAQLFSIAPERAPESASNTSASKPSASEPSASEGSAAVVAYFDQLRDLQGTFVQTIYDGRGEEESRGALWIKKPGKFFFDYQTPYVQQIVSDGVRVWQYDQDLAQVAVRGRDELVGDVAMALLTGESALTDLFTIQALAPAAAPALVQARAQEGTIYRLAPKNAQADYDAVWLVMQNEALAVLAVEIGQGQLSVLRFSDLRANAGIADAQFVFTPPAGVDVVGQ